MCDNDTVLTGFLYTVSATVPQGMRNPLDGVTQVTPHATPKPEDKKQKAVTGMYQYFLKVGCAMVDGHHFVKSFFWTHSLTRTEHTSCVIRQDSWGRTSIQRSTSLQANLGSYPCN